MIWKRNFFLRIGLPSTLKRRFGDQNRNFLKTLSKVDKFERQLGVLVLTAKRARTELFENTDVTTAILSLMQYLFKSVSVWTAKQFENYNVDGEHFIRFPDNKTAFLNLSGLVWT